MQEYKIITSRLIECREKMGFTKIEASKRIGVSQPAYLRYESGERTPSIQVVKEIANVFHTSSDYLIGKTDSPDIIHYVITEESDPALYQLIQQYYQFDANQKKRLLAYLDKISSNHSIEFHRVT